MKLIDSIIEYAGKTVRKGDLFSNKDLLAKGRQIFSSIFKDVQNVLLQHKPMLFTVVDNLIKNKLLTTDFPIIAGGLNQ